MICAAVRAESTGQALAEMQEARRAGADLAELRLDYVRDPDLPRLLCARPLPVVATVRPKWEGGRYEGTEAERLKLLEEACRHGADYVDYEHRAAEGFDRGRAKLVLSFHDFEKTPADIEETASEMRARGPFVVKVACLARGTADLARLVRLQRSLGAGSAVIAMGEFGEPLRLLHARYGGWLTYASVRAGSETAPGQLTVEDLVRRYRVKRIDGKTEVYGVIGDPVAHSRSPDLFNDVYRHLRMNVAYVRMRVDDASAVRGLVEAMDLRGLSVTIPHKQAAAAAVDERDDVVAATGSANTISARGGRLSGHNTDVPAALAAIREAAARKWSGGIGGMRALVLGAGGVSRAIAWGLKREGARVAIANRTYERGRALAEDLGVDVVRWEDLAGARPQVVVNGTSVGMAPKDGESPVDPGFFRGDMVALDTVYTPRRTRFLRDAEAAGAEAVDGVDMFLRQADLQFRIWAGRPMPEEVLREYSRRLG